MSTFQFGDIVVGNNPWLNSLLGFHGLPGVLVHVGLYSSIISLFITEEKITLMNDYIDKINYKSEKANLKIGDLVELKTEILTILNIEGIGIILEKKIITSSDFEGQITDDKIDAFLVYFNDMGCEYTIPCGCLRLFSPLKTD